MMLPLSVPRLRCTVFFLSLVLCSGAAAAEKSHRHFRFTPTRLRDSPYAASSVQLSEFELRLHGAAIDMSRATVANAGGNSPTQEGPGNLTDGRTATKWLDFNRRAVTFRFPAAVTIDAYSFVTANDAPERDPANWRLEGSDDGITWFLLDEVINGSVPGSRITRTGEFPLAATVPPYTSFWHPDYLLQWTPAADTSVDFNRSAVPLAQRSTDAAFNVNPNARLHEGRVAVLTTFGNTSYLASQGSASEHVNAYTGWQYTDKLVFWGGSAGEGLILAPAAPVIDAGHRNGVPVLGTVFFPPNRYGGQFHWVRTFLQQNGSRFPVADKLIEVARLYGFDGWFLNQETADGNASDAAAMRDFIAYCRAQAPELEIMWYDAMTSSGSISWQNALTSSNEMFLRNGSQPVAHSMFLNFWWNAGMLSSSRSRAQSLGIDPYSVYAGVDVESGGSHTAVDWNAVFPAGQAHRLSIAFYGQQRVFQNAGNPAAFQANEVRFWSGPNADPSNTATSESWKGLAHYIPATTPLQQTPFVTHFNRGQGNRFAVDGEVLMTSGWNNLSLQEVLPTWRWIVRSSGSPLQPSLELDDAYYGGTSLKITGTLAAANDVKLYAANLPVTDDTTFRLVFQSGQGAGPTHMQAALAFADAPQQFLYLDIGSAAGTGWQTVDFDLGAHAGRRIAIIGLRFASPATIRDYQMRIGRLAVFDGAVTPPAPPTNVRIARQDSLDADRLALRLKWDASETPGISFYQVFQRFPDGSRLWLGATPGNALFIPSVRRRDPASDLSLEVTAVGPDFGTSSAAALPVAFPPGPDLTYRLTGTSIGTEGSWQNNGRTRDKSFDGDLDTYFDAPSQAAWTGLDFGEGKAKRITAIRYHPRSGWTSRMVGGVFEAAHQADFSDAVRFAMVSSDPPEGVFTTLPVTRPELFRYFRYQSESGHGNVNEIEVYGYEAPAAPAGLTAELSGGAVELAWQASEWAAGYRLERGPAAGGPFARVAEVSGSPRFTDGAVPAGERPFYRVISLNPAGESPATEAVQAVPLSGYLAWQLQSFGSETSENVIGMDADPDGDLIPNVLEYALGTDPVVRNVLPLQPELVEQRLRITFPRNPAATDITLRAQWSDDLETWTEAGITYELLSEDDGRQSLRALAPPNPAGRRFMRLQALVP